MSFYAVCSKILFSGGVNAVVITFSRLFLRCSHGLVVKVMTQVSQVYELVVSVWASGQIAPKWLQCSRKKGLFNVGHIQFEIIFIRCFGGTSIGDLV